MERFELVRKLVEEGFSEKTLVNFNDKQLEMLSKKIVKESGKGALIMPKTATADVIKKATDSGLNVELREKLSGNQKNIDKNKNGKIDAEDFKLLKKDKKQKKEKLKEWIDKLVESNYHPIATKADIIETISKKIKETATPMPAGKPKAAHNGIKEFMEYNKPEKEDPDIETLPAEPTTPEKPREKPKHPGQKPDNVPNPDPKAKDTGNEKNKKKKKNIKEITPEDAKNKIIGVIGKALRK